MDYSIFDTEVSAFKNISSSPSQIKLGSWVRSCVEGTKFTKQILDYRRTWDKSIKLGLPLVTPGAVLGGGRKKEHIINRTGWIAIDIDGKDNPDFKDIEELRNALADIKFVALSSLSVSGKGVWLLVKVSDPQKQSAHFAQLSTDFNHIGINIDMSKGKNANDARFLSYDPDTIINNHFEIYNRLKNEEHIARKHIVRADINAFESSLLKIESNRLDIAPDYSSYLKIGFAIANEFGESGRDYFHRAVSYSEKYSYENADQQYSECLRSNSGKVSLGSFFYQFNKVMS